MRSKGTLEAFGLLLRARDATKALFSAMADGMAIKRREEPIPALSAGLSHVMMTGLILFAAFSDVHSQRFARPVPDIKVAHTPETAAAPAATDGTSSAAPPPVTSEPIKDEWPEADVAQAREQCMHLLSGVAVDFEMLEPVKKGECGLPAPILLKSVGSGPEVKFDPPVQVNCRMAVALGKWVKATLQPKAEERFQSQVVRIVGSYGYSCRNIYNLPNAKLSHHALANAIDIGGFGLENGRTIRVLRGWGPTERDIVAQAKAKAKAEAEAKAKAKADGAKGKDKGKGKDDVAQKDDPQVAAKSETEGARAKKDGAGVTQASLSLPAAKTPKGKKDVTSSDEAPAAKPAEPQKPTKEAQFLRAIHEGACKEFGTVLGPEANDPHRNHFHLDLIPRRNRGYCE